MAVRGAAGFATYTPRRQYDRAVGRPLWSGGSLRWAARRYLALAIGLFAIAGITTGTAIAHSDPRIPGLLERIQQPLYDQNTVCKDGTATKSFFEVPLGKSATASKSTTGGQPSVSCTYGTSTLTIYAPGTAAVFASLQPHAADVTVVKGPWTKAVMFTATNYAAVATLGGPGKPATTKMTATTDYDFLCLDQVGSFEVVLEASTESASAARQEKNMSVYLDGFFKREVH